MKDLKRIDYIDIARGIVISLMVLGHSYSKNNMIVHWLYSFHMPFFFIVTGFLSALKNEEKGTIVSEIKSKGKTLVFPYFIWGTIYQLFLGGLQILGGAPIGETLKLKIFMVFSMTGSAMWFLPSMFIASILFYILKNDCRIHIGSSIVLMAAGMILPKSGPIIECFLRACIGYLFMTIGFYGYNIYKKKACNRLFLVILFVSVGFSYLNGPVDMADRIFGNPILYLLNGLLGTWIMIQLCMKIEKYVLGVPWAFIKLWGEKSIIVLCTHGFVIQILRLLDFKIFNNILPSFGIIEGMVITIITLGSITLFMPFLVKCFGWTWGYKK